MFLTSTELESVMYSYQLEQITDNPEVIQTAINTAITEVRSYLTSNDQKAWQDGRPRYNVEAIFSAEGTNRNDLILQYTKIVALWHVIMLCNADIIYEHVKDRYDRVIDYLKGLASGRVNINLPQLQVAEENIIQPFRSGSRTKFNHEI